MIPGVAGSWQGFSAKNPACLKPSSLQSRQIGRDTLSFGRTLNEEDGALAIVDDFRRKSASLFRQKHNEERIPNCFVSHGDMVEAHARLVAPQLPIFNYQAVIINPEFRGHHMYVNRPLRELLDDITSDKRNIKAVCLSAANPVPIEQLREDLGLPQLTPENLMNYRDEIARNFDKLHLEKLPECKVEMQELGISPERYRRYLRTTLHLLQEIGKHAPVYVGAGNNGPGWFNLLLLAKGTIGVGALTADGQPWAESGVAGVQEWAEIGKIAFPQLCAKGKLKGMHLIPYEEYLHVLEQVADSVRHGKNPRELEALAGKFHILSQRVSMWNFNDLQPDAQGESCPVEYRPTDFNPEEWPKVFLPNPLRGTSCAAPQAAARKAASPDSGQPQDNSS